MRRAAVLWCAAAAALLASCGEAGSADPAAPAPWFAEEAAARGLLFAHDSGARGEYLMPEIMSGGAALFDMDGDGDLDAYLVQSGALLDPPEKRPPNQLFENSGTGTFTDVTEGSGAGDHGIGMGVACGDADGDGDVDLFVANLGTDTLLSNEGGGHFTIDACVTSQFEQQVRAICGLSLGDTAQIKPAAMVNLLGDLWIEGEPDWAAALAVPDVKLHLYGKAVAHVGRKMGHITALGDTVDEAAAKALAARDVLC